MTAGGNKLYRPFDSWAGRVGEKKKHLWQGHLYKKKKIIMPLPKKKVHLRLVGQKGKRASYPEQKKNIMHTVLHATHFQYTKGLKQKS